MNHLIKAFIFTVVLLLVSLSLTANSSNTPFISEIHYDNVGTDTGEFIEVSGNTGLNLSGFQLVLYNGANGLEYNTFALSGTIGGTGCGAVVLNLPTNGLQNGSPDGIALVSSSGAVIEFISYEGTFTANDGPASGMMSTNIGVTESGTTAVGSSLKRTNSGWTGPSPNSSGIYNDDLACITGFAAGTQTACDEASNAYTQQVIVTYNSPPTGSLIVNGQTFPVSSSPQTVTLSGLSSNGASVPVIASFSGSPICLTQANVFTAPVACAAGVPTVGEWGLINLALLILIFGVVAVKQYSEVIEVT